MLFGVHCPRNIRQHEGIDIKIVIREQPPPGVKDTKNDRVLYSQRWVSVSTRCTLFQDFVAMVLRLSLNPQDWIQGQEHRSTPGRPLEVEPEDVHAVPPARVFGCHVCPRELQPLAER